ncbi:MAG: hypothetical protein SGARI_007992 [Bacillariaceae sp.]
MAQQPAAANNRPPRVENDWIDDRVHDNELFFQTIDVLDGEAAMVPADARPNATVGRNVRGHVVQTPIRYGNLDQETATFLDAKGNALPVAQGGGANFSTRRLGRNNRTAQELLIDITKTLHYVLVARVPEELKENRDLFQAGSRPDSHLKSTKINFAARAIVVIVFDKNCNAATLSKACKSNNEVVVFLRLRMD